MPELCHHFLLVGPFAQLGLGPLKPDHSIQTGAEALMADLVPLLKKRAAGREISGLSAYEG